MSNCLSIELFNIKFYWQRKQINSSNIEYCPPNRPLIECFQHRSIFQDVRYDIVVDQQYRNIKPAHRSINENIYKESWRKTPILQLIFEHSQPSKRDCAQKSTCSARHVIYNCYKTIKVEYAIASQSTTSRSARARNVSYAHYCTRSVSHR